MCLQEVFYILLLRVQGVKTLHPYTVFARSEGSYMLTCMYETLLAEFKISTKINRKNLALFKNQISNACEPCTMYGKVALY